MAIAESVYLFYFFHFVFALLCKKGFENEPIKNLIEGDFETV